jgi:hypothetical protein
LNTRLLPDSPIEIVESRPLFRPSYVRQRNFGSLARLDDGRLLLAFRLGTGPVRANDGAVMITSSEDGGRTWADPMPLYAYPGRDGLLMGGLARLADDHIQLIFGRINVDLSLGGPEPVTDWAIFATTTRDGGRTWSEPGPEIRLFPYWTELYGASNPHLLSDGGLMWACIGTVGRDTDWQAGVTFTDASGTGFTPPTIIAAAPDRNFADMDIVRLSDGRFLAVAREMNLLDCVISISADEGQTWSPIRLTGFKGANIKLHRLGSGTILCAYRDEDPARPGVSCSVSDDGGETWRFIGQLYVPPIGQEPVSGSLCGYPDFVSLGEDEVLGVLNTYPDVDGQVDLYVLRLVDRS